MKDASRASHESRHAPGDGQAAGGGYRDSSISQGLVANQLAIAALMLFAVFAISILEALIPPSLLNPRWQIGLVSGLVNTGFLPLLGLILMQLSVVVKPIPRIMQLRVGVAHLAILVSFGYLLLVPLQVAAATRIITKQALSSNQNAMPGGLPLRQMEAAIREAPTAQILQDRLVILRGPRIAPQDLARPLPELKQILLSSLQEARQNLLRKSSGRESVSQMWSLSLVSLRLVLACLCYAAGYAVFAQKPGDPLTLFNQWEMALGMKPFGWGMRRSLFL